MRIIGDVLQVSTEDHLLLSQVSAWHVDRAYGTNDTVVQCGYKTRRFHGTEVNDLLCEHFYPTPLDHYSKMLQESEAIV